MKVLEKKFNIYHYVLISRAMFAQLVEATISISVLIFVLGIFTVLQSRETVY